MYSPEHVAKIQPFVSAHNSLGKFLMYLLISLTYIKADNIKSFTIYFIITFCNICFDMRDKTTKKKKRVKP